MIRRAVLSFLFTFLLKIHIIHVSSMVYHENSHVTFIREKGVPNDYFGYSVLLHSNGLYVGAPKASSYAKSNRTAGSVFVCSLENLDEKLVSCDVLGSKKNIKRKHQAHITNSLLKNDSWFGSSIAFLTDNILLITAPRLNSRYEYAHSPLQLQGACYVFASKRTRILEPLAEEGRTEHQGFKLDGVRSSYGSANETVYHYSLGQAGFSMKVTKNNTVLLGAPGLMQFTGGIISYVFNLNDSAAKSKLQPIVNTYNTLELDTDDYFGYSVESGIFKKNGSLLYIGGAPRADLGRGKVLVFTPPTDDTQSLDIKAKLTGPHAGSYFGSSLCCTDINNDGLDDLLVGAPSYVDDSDGLPYDQGAVFVYMAKKISDKIKNLNKMKLQYLSAGFILEEAGYVTGSTLNGARFGTAIADLGDIDADGFRDIAIGAPWELDGVGAVYIYMGNSKGLDEEKVQRIQPTGARGFGWSISHGVDVDENNCNDLAIGAYNSGAAYLYRCVPTVSVRALVRVPDIVNLPQNATTFTAMFCVCALPTEYRGDLKLDFIGRIKTDPRDNRSTIMGESQYEITVTPGHEICDEKTIGVNVTADLFKAIDLLFELEENRRIKDESTTFLLDFARVSDDSTLRTSLPVRVRRFCGEVSLCNPSLHMTLEPLVDPYVPGTNKRFGVKITLWNTQEPAYGTIVIISLPSNPRKIPSDCVLSDLTMTCETPEPFVRKNILVWEIDLEYNLNVIENISLTVTAEIGNKYMNVSENIQEVVINVTPEASFSMSGKSMPNGAITISRNDLAAGVNVSFKHYFEITNKGPSDWHSVIAHIRIPLKTYLTSSSITGCKIDQFGYECTWSVPAKVSYPVSISLQMDLSQEGNFLKRNIAYNATSSVFILLRQTKYELKYIGYEVVTTLKLEPARIIWCIVIPCIFLGLLLLAIIVRILYKRGFFLRKYNILLAEKATQMRSSRRSSDQIMSEISLRID